ncbi:MAG: SpoIIE family protein phosphatase [Crocinitomicaceae bacterium]
MRFLIYLLLLFFLGTGFHSNVFANKIDSLKEVLSTEVRGDMKSDLAAEIARRLTNIDNKAAVQYSDVALNYAIRMNDQLRIANALDAKGNAYNSMGESQAALEQLFKALSIYEELKAHKQIAIVTNSLANTFIDQEDYEKAINYYQASYEAGMIIKDTNAIAVPLVGLSIIYDEMGEIQKALNTTKEAIPLFEGINRTDAMVVCYVNASNYSYDLGMKDASFIWLQKAKKQNEQLKNKYFSGEISLFEAVLLADNGKLNEAVVAAENGIKLLREIDAKSNIMKAHKTLSDIYAENHAYNLAYHSLSQYTQLKDSLDTENKTEIMEELNTKYETAQKEKKISLLSAEKEIQTLENDKNKTIMNVLVGGSSLLLILSGFTIRANRQKKRANTDLHTQKSIVEEKNKEILDSIQYAKRIQNAIIPSPDRLQKHFQDSFVLYLPKDIVAGDFYWMETVGSSVLIAVADCTGHGVPGAMVSVVCNNALNRAVKEFNLTEPAKILDKTRDLVVEAFSKNQEEISDGMDISLCSWNKETQVVQWAGANNPLYIIRKENLELEILTPDKQPIGMYETARLYTNHSISVQPGDNLYLFSDGYADQFGSKTGKKYKYGRFRAFFKTHANQTMKQQKQLLIEDFLNWKGEFEQLDDVCVIGVRL